MTIAFLMKLLLWCTALNYGVLTLWFFAFVVAHDGIYRFHTTFFRLTREQFDALHYLGMSVYKIGVLLFFLVPYLALRMLT